MPDPNSKAHKGDNNKDDTDGKVLAQVQVQAAVVVAWDEEVVQVAVGEQVWVEGQAWEGVQGEVEDNDNSVVLLLFVNTKARKR